MAVKRNVGTLCSICGGKNPKSGDENDEKAKDSDANTSGPSTQTKETMPQGSETVQTAKEVRVFQSNWLSSFPRLRVDDTKDKMFCDICIQHKKNNTLMDGSSDFKNDFHCFTVYSTEHKVCTLVLFFRPQSFGQWPLFFVGHGPYGPMKFHSRMNPENQNKLTSAPINYL